MCGYLSIQELDLHTIFISYAFVKRDIMICLKFHGFAT